MGNFKIITHSFNFNESQHGWQHGFSDYPAGPNDSIFYALKRSYTVAPLDFFSERKAIMLSGSNHSDDLFMYLKRKIDNLEPNTNYTVTFEIEFASNARKGLAGIGGAPGESVFVKVGATVNEPKTVIEDGQYIMNIDKGNQMQSGEDMITIGDIAIPSDAGETYQLIKRSNATYTSRGEDNLNTNRPYVVKSNSKGELWLVVGTDSGFEGTTTIYYTKITAVLSRS